jgi:hypothetical protein
MIRRIIAHLVAIVALGGGIFFATESRKAAQYYEESVRRSIAYASAEALAAHKMRQWAETLTFGWYVDKTKKELDTLHAQMRTFQERQKRYTYAALLLLVGGAIAATIIAFSARTGVIWGSVSAAVMLLFGSLLPMLSVTLHKNVPYLGDVVFSYETKSLTGSIVHLFAQKEWAVAAAIVLFSVVVPWLKNLSMLAVALLVHRPFARKLVAFFKHLGKWSMLDVFVVATLLVFLTFEHGDVSRAEVGPGVYFFLGYVLMSLGVSVTAERMLSQRVDEVR